MKFLISIVLMLAFPMITHAGTVNDITLKNQFGETSINQIVSVSSAGKQTIGVPVFVDCGAYGGGAASAPLTCTGLATTDSILAVTQKVPGANNTAVTGFSTLIANGLKINWTADPGAGSVIRVEVQH